MGMIAGVLLTTACPPPPAELTEQDRAALEQVIGE
jgi:hypothetical protein